MWLEHGMMGIWMITDDNLRPCAGAMGPTL